MIDYKWQLKDLKNVLPNNYKVFSCFACGGGSSMGYKLAGFEVIGVCEIDKEINNVYLKNFKPKYNYVMGVQDLKKEKGLPEELFDLDILDGSPPCSTFSLAGEREKNWGKEKKFREGQAKQVLDDLFFEFLDVAELLKPKIIVAENVKGMLVGNAKGYINLIIKRFEEIGYDVQIFLLNSAVMGVPQRRERVFFIARRKDLKLEPIVLKFNEKPILYKEYKDTDYVPLNKDTVTYKRWLRRATKDNSIGDTVLRTEGGKISGFTTLYVKDNITPYTQTASVRHLRFDVAGFMSDRDVLLTQSFPVDYDCNGQDVEYICGMSVPPIMMYKIAEQIKVQLLDKIKKSGNMAK